MAASVVVAESSALAHQARTAAVLSVALGSERGRVKLHSWDTPISNECLAASDRITIDEIGGFVSSVRNLSGHIVNGKCHFLDWPIRNISTRRLPIPAAFDRQTNPIDCRRFGLRATTSRANHRGDLVGGAELVSATLVSSDIFHNRSDAHLDVA